MDERQRQLRISLLRWYDAHKRDLPWRATRDPYAVWVSEIMCQQTRVETVIPYYQRFLARFPDVRSLATANEDEVLALWSGLGYYRRARLLHRGVKEVVERYGGDVPADAMARQSLPGIGRYTAGAIGSIAFEQEEAIVDGNVARVLARIDAIDTPLGEARTERELWTRARELVRGDRPGDFNQAMMEFGARVCTPKAPRCGECPVREECRAFAADRVSELPVPRKRTAPQRVSLTAVVATVGERVVLVRGERALFGGLYAVPSAEDLGRAAARAALREAGVDARLSASALSTIEHVLSHRVLSVELWRATAARLREGSPARVFGSRELSAIGVSTLTRRILAAAQDQSASG